MIKIAHGRMEHSKQTELIGWVGTVILIGAYALVSLGVVGATGYFYQLMNIVASACLAYLSYRKGAYQNVVVNAILIVVGVLAVAKRAIGW